MRLLFASHTPRFSPFRVGSHHLSKVMAADGHTVVHLSTPSHLLRYLLDRGVGGPAAFTEDGVTFLTPTAIVPLRLGSATTPNASVLTTIPPIHRLLRRFGMDRPDAIVMDQPTFVGLERLLPHAHLCYRPTDRYLDPLRARAQSRVLARAGSLVVTSPELLSDLDPAHRLHSLVLPNGVDVGRFSGAEERGNGAAAVYVGALDERFDWSWVTAVAARAPEVAIRLAGPIAVRPPPDLPANVELLGPVAYEDTPTLMRSAQFGLLPFTVTPLNRARSPMKMFEYLASGLTVLAPRGCVAGYDDVPGVRWCGNPDDAATALAAPPLDPDEAARVRSVVSQEDWSSKGARLAGFLEERLRGTEAP
jgi:teichuronic acid biosynthesis glycosyltransferase TuaH